MGVAHRAGLVDGQGNIRNMDRALKADSSSSVVGACLGCTPVTSYVESVAGIASGGRTGLSAVTVGMLSCWQYSLPRWRRWCLSSPRPERCCS